MIIRWLHNLGKDKQNIPLWYWPQVQLGPDLVYGSLGLYFIAGYSEFRQSRMPKTLRLWSYSRRVRAVRTLQVGVSAASAGAKSYSAFFPFLICVFYSGEKTGRTATATEIWPWKYLVAKCGRRPYECKRFIEWILHRSPPNTGRALYLVNSLLYL